MMRRSSFPRLAGAAAIALLAVGASACARPGGLNPGLDGLPRRARVMPKPPTVHTSVYKHAPTMGWLALVVGPPSSPGPSLFARAWGAPCTPLAPGLSRVLPVAEGLPARSLARLGPIGVGIAGLPLADGPLAAPSGSALAEAMLERTSHMGTTGQHCRPSLFAYVRLGLGADLNPVSVLR